MDPLLKKLKTLKNEKINKNEYDEKFDDDEDIGLKALFLLRKLF